MAAGTLEAIGTMVYVRVTKQNGGVTHLEHRVYDKEAFLASLPTRYGEGNYQIITHAEYRARL